MILSIPRTFLSGVLLLQLHCTQGYLNNKQPDRAFHPPKAQKAIPPPPTANGESKTEAIPPQPNGGLSQALGLNTPQSLEVSGGSASSASQSGTPPKQSTDVSGTDGLIAGQYILGSNPQVSSGKSHIYKAVPQDADGEEDPVIVKLSPNAEALEREAKNYQRIIQKGGVEGEGLFVEVHDFVEQADPENEDLRDQAALIMEKGDKDLRTYIQKYGPLQGEMLLDAAWSAVRCVKAIHQSNMVWTELKSDNFVVTRTDDQQKKTIKGPYTSMEVKGIDLESAVKKEGTPVDFTPFCMPPEFALAFLCGREPDMKMEQSFDIWSLGILFYKMATGKNYFNSDKKDAYMIANGLRNASVEQKDRGSLDLYKHEEMKDVEDETFTELISWCLEFEPDKRPTIDQVIEHPFFSDRSL